MKFEVFPFEGNWIAYAQSLMERGQAEGSIPERFLPCDADNPRIMVARVATHDGFINAGGCLFYVPEPHMLWLDILYVNPEYRRQGIGNELVVRTRQIAIAEGHSQFGLGTTLSNFQMLSLVHKAAAFSEGIAYFHEDLPARSAN